MERGACVPKKGGVAATCASKSLARKARIRSFSWSDKMACVAPFTASKLPTISPCNSFSCSNFFCVFASLHEGKPRIGGG
jgi:hypothetical protein